VKCPNVHVHQIRSLSACVGVAVGVLSVVLCCVVCVVLCCVCAYHVQSVLLFHMQKIVQH
jgi:hypothetical protein